MKVRITPLPHINKDYYFEYYFTPEHNVDGKVIGYRYDDNGWYGSEIFKTDLKGGIIKIIIDIKPKQELKKFSLI